MLRVQLIHATRVSRTYVNLSLCDECPRHRVPGQGPYIRFGYAIYAEHLGGERNASGRNGGIIFLAGLRPKGGRLGPELGVNAASHYYKGTPARREYTVGSRQVAAGRALGRFAEANLSLRLLLYAVYCCLLFQVAGLLSAKVFSLPLLRSA